MTRCGLQISLLTLCASTCIAILPGCRQEVASPDTTASESSISVGTSSTGAAHEPPIKVVDRLNREVLLTHIPQRIVSLSPSITELLFAIGAGPTLVGATMHCNYPPEALQITRVGSGMLDGISRETIIALKPDLVLGLWDTHEPLIEFFNRTGIPLITLGPESLDELFEHTKLLGQATGHTSEAIALVSAMTERRARLAARVATIEPSEQRKVFYEVWDDPLMTVGPKSYIGELLTMAHMKNIFIDTDLSYPRISSEVVVDRNPDVILAPSNHMKQVEFSRMAARAGWSNISAIAQKQVFVIDGDKISRCGPRLLDALEQMIDAVYPATRVRQ